MFDYVVIGAGTAGCALAARLTEDPTIQVLLMEAGPPDRARAIRIPLAFPKLFQTPLDWNFWTQAQSRMGNRHLYWPRGRMLGGSGSLGAMVHMDACAADFAEWDVPGWSAAEMSELPQKLDAEPVAELNPLTLAFLDACEAAGLPRKEALTDASKPIAAPFRLNTKGGKRWSAADEYLRPALQRGNLTVWTGVHVRRVLSENGRASGVEYSQAGALQTVAVAREILLCAGTVGSPHLLLLSGVGPLADLEACGVPVVAALAGVGSNLQDHLAAPVSYFSLEPISLSGTGTFSNEWKHRLSGTGPLASNGAEAGAMVQTELGLPACDVEIAFAAGHYVDHGFASPGGHGFSLVPALLTPKSRGQIRLASSDPEEAPLIDPAYLSDDRDMERLVEGVLFARRLLDQAALSKYRGAPVQGHVDEPEKHIREWGQTLYHPVGSCKMGSGEDAVVDASLRVHGVTGLRVVDASVMPKIPRAQINATTVLIAEKAAQLIKS
ncbi:MAG: GMC oxidoreductase [Bryobacteraceae bacterium]